MESKPRCDFFAERQAPLITHHAVAGSSVAAPGGNDQAKTRRGCGKALVFLQQLITIVNQHIANAVLLLSFVAKVRGGDRERNLVLFRKQRPLVDESKSPAP